jgi:hypothetical protein
VDALHSSRGCAFGDFDNDGDVDIVIVNHNEAPSLLRNDVTGTNHWLKIKLTGVQSNRNGIGARVTRSQAFRAVGPRTAADNFPSSLIHT